MFTAACEARDSTGNPVLKYHGCDTHIGRGRERHRGNPTRCVKWKNAMAFLKKDLRGYKECGDSQLTPSELLQIRNWCLAQGSSYYFQIYTMLIVMVKLFLRCDDADFAFDAFEMKHFIVSFVFLSQKILIIIL